MSIVDWCTIEYVNDVYIFQSMSEMELKTVNGNVLFDSARH